MMLKVENLSIHFEDRSEKEEVVKNVSFAVEAGDILGIVGESGSGKTMTALTIAGLLKKHAVLDGGRIWLDDTDLLTLSEKEMRRIQGNEIGMIFQEPMTALNPTMRIGKQVEEALLLHDRPWGREGRKESGAAAGKKMTKAERRQLALGALEEVELENPGELYRKYPYELSGGMRQRVMIAAAMVCRPKLLIADEPTTALDVTIQAQILELLKELQKEQGCSIMLITHDLGVVAEMADFVVVMYAGKIIEMGTAEDIFDHPMHPYTIGLQKSKPSVDGEVDSLYCIPGFVPNPVDMPDYCYFRDRCDRCLKKCAGEYPELVKVTDTHSVSCYLYNNEKEAGNGGADDK